MDTDIILWLALFFSIFILSIYIVIKQKTYKSYSVISIILPLFPITGVTIDCYQNRSSEACVWGQAFIPLYLIFSVLAATPIVFLIYYFGKKLWLKFN